MSKDAVAFKLAVPDSYEYPFARHFRSLHWEVRPRYSGGSPAMVDAETCLKVAKQERYGYAAHYDGAYGPDLAKAARFCGLKGICFCWREVRGKISVYDLLTMETAKVAGLGDYFLEIENLWKNMKEESRG